MIDEQKQSRQKGKAGKLYCCFVDFMKAFGTLPRAVLWQVLEVFQAALIMQGLL